MDARLFRRLFNERVRVKSFFFSCTNINESKEKIDNLPIKNCFFFGVIETDKVEKIISFQVTAIFSIFLIHVSSNRHHFPTSHLFIIKLVTLLYICAIKTILSIIIFSFLFYIYISGRSR